MRAIPLGIDGALKLQQDVWRDERGVFIETWNARSLAQVGLDATFVQDNLSMSKRWTVRGLHYQITQPQGKLIRVLTGKVYDVFVDLRRSSPTFGRTVGIYLSADDYEAIWVPPGCAHGFLALQDDTRVTYKVTDFWAPGAERTLMWNDPALGIEWPLPPNTTPIISQKDASGTPLAAAATYA